MLRTNSVPWLISPSQPAILPVYVGVWFERRDLVLHSLSPSEEVDSIYCISCLAGDGERTNECVILRCEKCKHLSHLACTEDWLQASQEGMSCCSGKYKRSSVANFITLMMNSRRQGAWAALVRSRNVHSLGSEALTDSTATGGG
jgi:hypothetical protein